MTETVWDQSVELFHAEEGVHVEYLKTRFLLGAVGGALGWAVACFTFGSCALSIGPWVGVVEIIPVLGAFLWAVLIALFPDGLKGDILVALFVLPMQQP